MIGTIRKHSKWLWYLIAGLTIISFVVFMGSGPTKGGGIRPSSGFGTIYGKTILVPDMQRAQGEFYIYYWLRSNGQWPNKAGGLSAEDIERETYIRLLISRKAEQLDIHVSEDELATAASELLRSLGQNGQPVKMQDFVDRVLAPEHLTLTDLLNFLRDELVIQQMIQTLGLAGSLVTPQEAGLLYDRENQEVLAQAVFFAASNYLAQVSTTPAAVAQFYTNNMAVYRQPDRVQVSYVFYNVTNYLEGAKAFWAKSNLTEYVESVYRQYGATEFAGQTPEEAKVKIRELVIRNRALADARQVANEFATELFATEPAKAENLTALANKKGLPVRTTLPFTANDGPSDLEAPAAFTKSAFQLNAEEQPFAGPMPAADGFYVIALANHLPSAIPPLAQIQGRVTQDYEAQAAVGLAQRAGTNYYYALTVQMAAGKTFAQAAVAAGQAPLPLPSFSLSTADLPEIGTHASIGQIKQAAFTTAVGKVSNFVPTAEGGFVLFVQQMQALDETKKQTALPQFSAQVRRARQSEAFQLWLQGEINRELRDTPFFRKQAADMAKQP